MINLQFLFPSVKILVILLKKKMSGPASTEANDTFIYTHVHVFNLN